MKIQDFLAHHGIAANPFANEDAQTDPVFKDHCIGCTYHPAWDKVYGDPAEPATSVVFGEKGAGKTAMRLQIVRHLAQYNVSHPSARAYIVQYDDFNPFLDRFAERLGLRHRSAARVLAQWKLWDHMDAILSLAVTSLIDRILEVKRGNGVEGNQVHASQLRQLDRHQARDLLLLAACYDRSVAATFPSRWSRLRRALRFRVWHAYWDRALGLFGVAAVIGAILLARDLSWLARPWPYVAAAAAWLPWFARAWTRYWTSRGVVRQIRVGGRESGALRKVLMRFTKNELSGQPLPTRQRSDDRYEMLMKLQSVLQTLGFTGLIVLVDRVDEPHLINGSAEPMRALVWSLLDNKFLKHPGLGLKLLLPVELALYLEREDRDFYQRARLDKQNLVPSLEWTGEALYDMAAARLKACAANGKTPTLKSLFDESVTDERLFESLRLLRVPRHLFKFLYRLMMAHCNAHTDDRPVWNISSETFEATLAVYRRDQDAVDRGLRAG